jgi:hypothetical protein
MGQLRSIKVPTGSEVIIVAMLLKGESIVDAEPIRISTGIQSEIVEFSVSIDTELHVVSARRAQVTLTEGVSEAACSFVVRSSQEPSEASCWIRVEQQRRTVQSIDFTITSVIGAR